jgi:predicted transcriptional regulator
MHDISERDRPDWGQEQLRYRILERIYESSGAQCENPISGTQIGSSLDLRYEELFRTIHFLEHNGYLDYLDVGPRVCITRKGIRYIEEHAGRRRSIRSGTSQFAPQR